MRRMRLRAVSPGAAALLLWPAAALAGAPNYDCVAGDGGRLSIDLRAGIVAAAGFEPGPTVWGAAKDMNGGAESLDVVAVLRGSSWKVAVRETGTSLVIKRPSGTLRGRCVFVPGNYVLRPADAGGSTLRAGPRPDARWLLSIPRGTAVWQIPTAGKGDWMRIRAFVVRDGKIRPVDGWLQQKKRLEPRYR